MTSVINKKYKVDAITGDKKIAYCLNSGVFDSFLDIVLENLVLDETNTLPFNKRFEEKYNCALIGPTNEKIDLLSSQILLPDLEVGDHLIHLNMGAYTVSLLPGRSGYGGFSKSKVKYYVN